MLVRVQPLSAHQGILQVLWLNKQVLKGLSVGDAQVSHKHAGFVINTGNAKAKDALDLIKEVQNAYMINMVYIWSQKYNMIGED